MSPEQARCNAHSYFTCIARRAGYAREDLEAIPKDQRTAQDILALKAAKKALKHAENALKGLAAYAHVEPEPPAYPDPHTGGWSG